MIVRLINLRGTRAWLLLALITAVAAGIRFYRLADYPPGLHYDEAFHQVEAVGILQGYRPIYFPENMGMDPLHIYLIAWLYRLFGVTAIGGRLISAAAGTLTVPVTWWLAQELFAERLPGERLALSAAGAGVLATMQWHVTFSRTGIQPVLVPLLLALCVASLWRGLRTGRWPWFVLSGVSLGLGPYAYSSARVTPLLIVGIGAWLLIFDRERARRHGWGLLVCAGVSVVVFAPLGAYFIRHWEWFTFRATQVTYFTLGDGSTGPIQVLWRNLVRTLAALNVRGDPEVIRNLPGRPALDPFQSLLFWVGVGACAWRVRRPAYATLLGWVGVMLLPTVLTEFAPHFGRALGATPAIALLVGLGAVSLWAGVRRITKHEWPWALPASAGLLVVGLVASAIGHGHAYLIRWGSLSALHRPYDVGLLAAAREVRDRLDEAEVYLSPISMGHPILRFVLWDRPGARSYDGRYTLVLPSSSDRPADYVIVPSIDDRSLSRLQALYPEGEIVGSGGLLDDEPYYRVYRVPSGAMPQLAVQEPVDSIWADQIALVGYSADRARYRPGDECTLALYWRSMVAVETDYTMFVHLLGTSGSAEGGPVLAGWDQEPGRASYPTSAWVPGEVVIDEYSLTLPGDMAPGTYELEVGVYELATMQRLPVSRADRESGPDYVIVSTIVVE